ncbi:hypothetical protein ONE63_010267 [Megalurothrips usitatus]|uniref:Uncharacterized protein n=1 Tax=Megalurothrips usitatus TaxID=439358 RepID=A0AAV7XIY2_9NEOP|nr:hypothetical protein ONE63_010267 [Megalurothrips usitatus]
MSPHRRKTRGSLSTDVQAALKPLASKNLAVRRTRSGHQSATQSLSPSKTNKSPKQSPLKQQRFPHVSSPRKSLVKPSPSKKVSNALGKTPRTPEKSPKRSPVKSRNNSSHKGTSGNVLISKIKKEPQSPSQSVVEVNGNLKTKVVKIEPESPSKTSMPEVKCEKTTPKSSGSKLVSHNVHESSPSHLRITRGTSAANSPVSAKRNASKSSPQKFSKVINSHLEENSSDSVKMLSPSSRKRHLPSLSSPRSTKIRRSRGNVLISMHTNDATSLEQESSVVGDVKTEGSKTSGLPLVTQKSNPQTSDSDSPELNSRFMRRKWFSLKTRGGFTCLRSAVLTPQEIAQEILQKTMSDTSQTTDSNFFTTKLMVRLSSKLPPVRARPSCEELVDLINSKQIPKKIELIADPKVEGTALRVKVEKRSLSDTITHVTRNPPQIKPASSVKSNKSPKGIIVNFGERSLTKKQERDIALRQLKNLRNL